MIHSTSPLHGYNRTDAATLSHAKTASTPAVSSDNSERLSSTSSSALREALNNSPEVRPEVVARAKTLAVDPNYPPREIIEGLARLMIESRDVSE